MPVTCTFQDVMLTLSIVGMISNQEIETALEEALAGSAARSGMKLLWDHPCSGTRPRPSPG